jgi:DNA-binding MarR family transcriptional regulator
MTEPTGHDLTKQLRTALRDLRIELATHTSRVADRAGLNDSDLAVLDVLAREGAQTPTALAQRTGMHPATMTAVLGRLKKSGWITRRTSTTDRRSVHIEPTGIHQLTDIYHDTNHRLDEIAAALRPQEQRTVLAYLRAVTEAARTASDALDEQHPTR